MPSPFPGMDPYIESSRSWTGFHNAFLVACAQQLNERLPENYVARIEERLQILSDEEEREFGVIPDSVVSLTPTSRPKPIAGLKSVATLEPLIVPQDIEWLDEPRELFLRIHNFPEERVVTALEVLSPSYKSGKGRQAYLAKRFEYRHQNINLVEIDLLLGGDRVPLLAPLPAGDYFAFVTRAVTRHQCEVYSWSVREPLPKVPIPLDENENDIPLDLKSAFDRTYDGGRYGRTLRYTAGPPPTLAPADRAWAAEIATAMSR